MARQKRVQKSEEAQVDMTPMLDVTFIMLIFFVVTMSFVQEPGVTVSKPEAVTTQVLKHGNILIGVTANNEIWMKKHQLELADVTSQVEQAKATTPKGTVVVVADQGANTQTVIDVMDRARAGGADNVWIATVKQGGS